MGGVSPSPSPLLPRSPSNLNADVGREAGAAAAAAAGGGGGRAKSLTVRNAVSSAAAEPPPSQQQKQQRQRRQHPKPEFDLAEKMNEEIASKYVKGT